MSSLSKKILQRQLSKPSQGLERTLDIAALEDEEYFKFTRLTSMLVHKIQLKLASKLSLTDSINAYLSKVYEKAKAEFQKKTKASP